MNAAIIFLSIFQNVICVARIAAGICFVCYMLYVLLYAVESTLSSDHGWQSPLSKIKKFKFFLAFLVIISCLPNMDELWQIRISLIKIELSSPENLKATTDTIERIGKKLECKYLGCNEDKNK